MSSRDYEALSKLDPVTWDDLELHYRKDKTEEDGYLETAVKFASWVAGGFQDVVLEFPPTNTHMDITQEQGNFLKTALTNWLKGTSGGVTYSDLSNDLKKEFKERIKELGITDDSESYKLLVAGFNKENFTTKGAKQPFYLDAVFKPVYQLKSLQNSGGSDENIKRSYLLATKQVFLGEQIYPWIDKYSAKKAPRAENSESDPEAKLNEEQLKQLEKDLKDASKNAPKNDGTPVDAQERENTNADYVNALQCALMSQLIPLANNRKKNRSQPSGYSKEKYKYKGRVLNVETNEPENVINDMTLTQAVTARGLMPKGFFDLLTSYFEVFSVTEKGEEEYFPNILGAGKVNVKGEAQPVNMQSALSSGELFYLDSANIEYEGGTPATARSDVTVDLTYKFRGLAVLESEYNVLESSLDRNTGQRIPDINAGSSHTVRPIDLILTEYETKKSKGYSKVYRRQYDPNYRRIRIRYGTFVPEYLLGGRSQAMESVKRKFAQLQKGRTLTDEMIKKLGNSDHYLDLTIVDHNLQIQEKGNADEWQITLSYRGYMQQMLTSPIFNALQTKEDLKKIQKREDEMLKQAAEANCTSAQFKRLQRQLNGDIESRIKKTYKNFVERLITQNLVLNVDVPNATLDDILRGEFDFETQDAFDANKDVEPSKEKKKPEEKPKEEKEEEAKDSHGNKLTPEEKKQKKEQEEGLKQAQSRKDKQPIAFFYIGDALRVAGDAIYDEKTEIDKIIKEIGTLNDVRFIACPFNYKNPRNSSQLISINITEIPISLAFFQSWFHENVVKKNKKNYPIGSFTRDLCEIAMTNLISEFCVGDELEPKVHYKTSFFRAKKINIQQDSYYSTKQAKLKYTAGSERLVTYFVIHPVNQNYFSRTTDGTIKNLRENNVPYLPFGLKSLTGPVNKINFNKQDAPYLREARFFNSANSGLSLLSNVYDANIDLDPVFDYYPGSLIWIDPVDLTKSKPNGEGEPWNEGSIAYVTGLGGYHVVTKSSVKFTNFTTSLRAAVNVVAKWVHSGDDSSTKDSRDKNKKIDKQSDKSKKNNCDDLIKKGTAESISQIETPPEENTEDPPEET